MSTAAFERMVAEEVPGARTLEFVHDFFFITYKTLSEKTRSIVEFSLLGFLYGLLKEPTYSLFCKNPSTFNPEDCLDGKIIVLNIPVKDYHHVGQDCQIMFKYIWQRAMERRRVTDESRPVFLWADEAQNFLHEHDADYQATARSSLIATVYISQNLPNYYANMGGNNGIYKVKSFLGTLSTKIFHANADMETNKFASELFGQEYVLDKSKSFSLTGDLETSNTIRLQLENKVRPEQFTFLKTGGPANEYWVQGYLHCQGKELAPKENYKLLRFNQNYK